MRIRTFFLVCVSLPAILATSLGLWLVQAVSQFNAAERVERAANDLSPVAVA
jgi:hypothetical protein